jgi:hypothetical protein
MTQTFVYAIYCPNKNEVKIGYATDPLKRLASLQTGTTDRLDLLFTFRGGLEEEKQLHERFKTQRISGEWFSYDTPFSESITSFALNTFPFSAKTVQEKSEKQAIESLITSFLGGATTKPRKNIPLKYLVVNSGFSRELVLQYCDELGYENTQVNRVAHVRKR